MMCDLCGIQWLRKLTGHPGSTFFFCMRKSAPSLHIQKSSLNTKLEDTHKGFSLSYWCLTIESFIITCWLIKDHVTASLYSNKTSCQCSTKTFILWLSEYWFSQICTTNVQRLFSQIEYTTNVQRHKNPMKIPAMAGDVHCHCPAFHISRTIQPMQFCACPSFSFTQDDHQKQRLQIKMFTESFSLNNLILHHCSFHG